MIDKSLTFLTNEVNAHLTLNNGPTAYQVELSNIMTQGNTPEMTGDGVALTLVNTEEEYAYKDQNSYRTLSNGEVAKVSPEIKLNLYVMFSANFKVYDVGLNYLSQIVKYFQTNRHFSSKNAPLLDSEIDFLSLELYTLNFEQINQLWGALGAKYRPCILYKVRMLVVQEDVVKQTTVGAESPSIGTSPIN